MLPIDHEAVLKVVKSVVVLRTQLNKLEVTYQRTEVCLLLCGPPARMERIPMEVCFRVILTMKR